MPRTKTGKGAGGAGSIRKITTTRNGKTYTYWQGRYTEGFDPGTGKQIQRSITGKTQKEVAQKLRQITASLDDGTYKAPCKLTVGEWLDIWTQDYLGGVKSSTAYLYKKNVELYITPHLGNIKLESLNAHTIQHFYNQLVSPTDPAVNPLSAKTVKNIHGVFHKAMQQAVLIGYLRVNPTDACTLPRVIKKEMHPLEEDQVTAFLKEVQGSPHEYLYKIALFTGLREGEILGLGWDHIDLENGILTVKRQLRKEQKRAVNITSLYRRTIVPAVFPWHHPWYYYSGFKSYRRTVFEWKRGTLGRKTGLSFPIRRAGIYPIARCMTASSAL